MIGKVVQCTSQAGGYAKTKAELAQELHDWKVRSTEQAITMQAEVALWKNHAACLKEENSTQTKAIFKLQAETHRLTIVNLEQFFRLELQNRANMPTQNQPTKDDGKQTCDNLQTTMPMRYHSQLAAFLGKWRYKLEGLLVKNPRCSSDRLHL